MSEADRSVLPIAVCSTDLSSAALVHVAGRSGSWSPCGAAARARLGQGKRCARPGGGAGVAAGAAERGRSSLRFADEQRIRRLVDRSGR